MTENKRFYLDETGINDREYEFGLLGEDELVDIINELNDENIELHIQNDFLKNENQHMRDLVNENKIFREALKELKQFQKNTMDLIQSFKDRDLLPIERFLINNFEEELVEKTIKNNYKGGKKND